MPSRLSLMLFRLKLPEGHRTSGARPLTEHLRVAVSGHPYR